MSRRSEAGDRRNPEHYSTALPKGRGCLDSLKMRTKWIRRTNKKRIRSRSRAMRRRSALGPRRGHNPSKDSNSQRLITCLILGRNRNLRTQNSKLMKWYQTTISWHLAFPCWRTQTMSHSKRATCISRRRDWQTTMPNPRCRHCSWRRRQAKACHRSSILNHT